MDFGTLLDAQFFVNFEDVILPAIASTIRMLFFSMIPYALESAVSQAYTAAPRSCSPDLEILSLTRY